MVQKAYCHKRQISILDAVGDERCLLEKLIIDDCNLDHKLVAAALERNKRLRHFKLRYFTTNRPSWERVSGAICTHPTLRALRFSHIATRDVAQDSEQRQRTEDVAAMLTTNHRVSDVAFCPNTFDQATWDDRWTATIGDRTFAGCGESNRLSLLAVCLAQVSSNPSIVNMLLSNNQGVIASYGWDPFLNRLSRDKSFWTPIVRDSQIALI